MALDKNIFLIHKSYDSLNAFEKVCYERWKYMNQDFEWGFLTDKDIDPFIESNWPKDVSVYRDMPTVIRASIQRLGSVYRDGGIYADCDLYPLKKVSDFLKPSNDLDFFYYLGEPKKVHDYLFYASRNHPLIWELIDRTFHAFKNNSQESLGTCWKGWIFSCTIHMWSAVLETKGITARSGCADSIHELRDNVDACHTIHFSAEHWLRERRWGGSVEREVEDCFNALSAIKNTHGL